jgi:AcrR family transcriptional regulator
VPSLSSTPERNIPQQDRASRRLEAILDTAEEVFTELGFEAATMTAIAERSGTSIGGLYRYFPDKAAVAYALLKRYREQGDRYWTPLIEEAKSLPVRELASRLVVCMEEFAVVHPAYLPLLAAPYKFPRDAASLHNLRMSFSKAFRARKPELKPERALLIATVVLRIIGGMLTLYVEAAAKGRPAINAEFKRVLANYLAEVLQ